MVMSSFSTGYNGVNLARRANIRRVNRVSNAGRAVICSRIRSRSCMPGLEKEKNTRASTVARLVSTKYPWIRYFISSGKDRRKSKVYSKKGGKYFNGKKKKEKKKKYVDTQFEVSFRRIFLSFPLFFFFYWRSNDTLLAWWYAMMTLDREDKGSSYFARVRKTTRGKRRE